jgi:hypothetical protein
MQVWPALRQDDATTSRAALATSASSNTTKGALPPSSRDSRLTVPAAAAYSALPTRVDPVKETLRTASDAMTSRRKASPAAAAPC